MFEPSRLPLEITDLILALLEVKDKARLTRLDRAWNRFLNTYTRAWTVLDFGIDRIDTKCLELYCFKANYNVTVCRMLGQCLPDDLGVLQRCCNLRKLELGKEPYTHHDPTTSQKANSFKLQSHTQFTSIMNVVENCTRMKSISLNINIGKWEPIWTASLSTDVKVFKLFTTEAGERLGFETTLFQKAHNLEELVIMGYHDLANIGHLKNLSTLILDSCCNLGEHRLPASLRKLHIYNSHGVMLERALPIMTRLEELSLEYIFGLDEAVCTRIMKKAGTKLKDLLLHGVFTGAHRTASDSQLLLVQSCRSLDLQCLVLEDVERESDQMLDLIGSKFLNLADLWFGGRSYLTSTNLENCVKKLASLRLLVFRDPDVQQDTVEAIRKRGIRVEPNMVIS